MAVLIKNSLGTMPLTCSLSLLLLAYLTSSANAQQFEDTVMELDCLGISENCMEALNSNAPNCPSFLIGVSVNNPRLDLEQLTALCTLACHTALTNVRQTISSGCNLDTDVVEFDGVIWSGLSRHLYSIIFGLLPNKYL